MIIDYSIVSCVLSIIPAIAAYVAYNKAVRATPVRDFNHDNNIMIKKDYKALRATADKEFSKGYEYPFTRFQKQQ